MRKVTREEIVDYQTYGDQRDELRPRILEMKVPRRVHIGPHLTLLFENAELVRYQVQEMMRAERIVREADIEHELATYNELLGDAGELGATMLIEIDDPAERAEKLRAWLGLQGAVYLSIGSRRVYASFDPRQVGDERLSAVQYVKFDVGGQVPERAGCDLPAYTHEVALTEAQRAALAADLAD